MTNTWSALRQISLITNTINLVDGIIAKKFKIKIQVPFHFNPWAKYPSGIKTNNKYSKFIHESLSTVLRVLFVVDWSGTPKIGVSELVELIDDCDKLSNDIIPRYDNLVV